MEWIVIGLVAALLLTLFACVWQALGAARTREDLTLAQGQADHFAGECSGLRDRIDRAETAAVGIATSVVLEAGSRFADERETLRYDRDMLRDELARVQVAKALTPSDFVLLRDAAFELQSASSSSRSAFSLANSSDVLAADVRALAERLEKS